MNKQSISKLASEIIVELCCMFNTPFHNKVHKAKELIEQMITEACKDSETEFMEAEEYDNR